MNKLQKLESRLFIYKYVQMYWGMDYIPTYLTAEPLGIRAWQPKWHEIKIDNKSIYLSMN